MLYGGELKYKTDFSFILHPADNSYGFSIVCTNSPETPSSLKPSFSSWLPLKWIMLGCGWKKVSIYETTHTPSGHKKRGCDVLSISIQSQKKIAEEKKRARCKARKQITIEQWGWKWKWIKKKIEHTISVSTLLLIHHFLLWSVCRMNG